jgi:hypothetical protein
VRKYVSQPDDLAPGDFRMGALEVFGYAELPPDLQLQPALVLKEAPPLPV